MKSSTDTRNGTTLNIALKPEDNNPSKLRVIKNLALLSVSWWMLFSAYDGLVMLQSTLNSDKGIGVITVSLQYACGCLSALLLPKYFIRKFGCKAVIVVCIVSHAPYIASNFYPNWILMIPSSILLGIANPLIWAAACAYLNNLSTIYTGHIQNSLRQVKPSSENTQEVKYDSATTYFHNSSSVTKTESESLSDTEQHIQNNLDQMDSKNELPTDLDTIKGNASKILEHTTSCFFGIHGTVYTMNVMTSNIISYYILRIGIVKDGYATNTTCNCGSDFCNDELACFTTNLKPPSHTMRYILTGVFVGLVVLSLIVIVLFLDNLGRKRENVSLSLEHLMAVCKLLKRPNMFLLIPMQSYIGIFQGFFMGDYTQAYVGCAWGIHNVGLVTATFGLTLALSSTLSGWLMKYVGRCSIFLCSAALNVATIIILLLWQPDAERPAMMFVVSGFIGLICGSYWTQIRAFMGIIFKEDEEAAFGNYQLWHSVGVSIAFGYSKYLCTAVKIYILLVISTLAILGYVLVERSHSKETQSKQLNK